MPPPTSQDMLNMHLNFCLAAFSMDIWCLPFWHFFFFLRLFQVWCWRRGWDSVSCCQCKFYFRAVVERVIWMRQTRSLRKTKKGWCITILEHETWCHTRSFKFAWSVIVHFFCLSIALTVIQKWCSNLSSILEWKKLAFICYLYIYLFFTESFNKRVSVF